MIQLPTDQRLVQYSPSNTALLIDRLRWTSGPTRTSGWKLLSILLLYRSTESGMFCSKNKLLAFQRDASFRFHRHKRRVIRVQSKRTWSDCYSRNRSWFAGCSESSLVWRRSQKGILCSTRVLSHRCWLEPLVDFEPIPGEMMNRKNLQRWAFLWSSSFEHDLVRWDRQWAFHRLCAWRPTQRLRCEQKC